MAVQSGFYRGLSAPERAARRRVRLLEATLAVWADPDTRTTMTAICAQAGLSERYFYESFPGLEEALRALLDQVASEIETSTLAAADAAGDDPAARIRAALQALIDLLLADPRKGRAAIIEAAAVPALRARRTQLLRHFAHLATEEASAADAIGHDLAGVFFIGGMAEVVTAWIDGSLDTSPEEVVATASRAFLALRD
ncbi:MAG: TetR/AcrR family transcriptional regulator [Nocardioidaceae bacterium]|nr:TetR/AcrR family transcriptional regulator [Nocardioidaceae bacterium]